MDSNPSADDAALKVLNSLKCYLSDYNYELEYYLEGYAIRLLDNKVEGHFIIIFYNLEEQKFSITSFYNNKLCSEISCEQEKLTQTVLTFIMMLETPYKSMPALKGLASKSW